MAGNRCSKRIRSPNDELSMLNYFGTSLKSDNRDVFVDRVVDVLFDVFVRPVCILFEKFFSDDLYQI